jgi:hypothetical protein
VAKVDVANGVTVVTVAFGIGRDDDVCGDAFFVLVASETTEDGGVVGEVRRVVGCAGSGTDLVVALSALWNNGCSVIFDVVVGLLTALVLIVDSV